MKGRQGGRINRSTQKCKRRIISEALSETGFNFALPAGACPSRLSLPLFTSTFWAKGRHRYVSHHTFLLFLSQTGHGDTVKSAYLTLIIVLLMEGYCPGPVLTCCQLVLIAGDEHNTRLGCPYHVKPRAKNMDKTELVLWGGQIPSSNGESAGSWQLRPACLSKTLLFSDKDRLESGELPLCFRGLGIKLDGNASWDNLDNVSKSGFFHGVIHGMKTIPPLDRVKKNKCWSYWILIMYCSVQLGISANSPEKETKNTTNCCTKFLNNKSKSSVSPLQCYWFFTQPVERYYFEMISREVWGDIKSLFFILRPQCWKLWRKRKKRKIQLGRFSPSRWDLYYFNSRSFDIKMGNNLYSCCRTGGTDKRDVMKSHVLFCWNCCVLHCMWWTHTFLKRVKVMGEVEQIQWFLQRRVVSHWLPGV